PDSPEGHAVAATVLSVPAGVGPIAPPGNAPGTPRRGRIQSAGPVAAPGDAADEFGLLRSNPVEEPVAAERDVARLPEPWPLASDRFVAPRAAEDSKTALARLPARAGR